MRSALCGFLFVHFDGHVRADAPAKSAGGAFASVLEDNKMVSLLVELLRQADTLLRTADDTELTSLATFLVDDNLAHNKTVSRELGVGSGVKSLNFVEIFL